MTFEPNYVAFTPEEWAWRSRGLCTDQQDDLFFSDTLAPPRRAVDICRQCPVAADCLDYAMSQTEMVRGVWGGTSERQRRRAKKKQPPINYPDLTMCPSGLHDNSEVVPRKKTLPNGRVVTNGRRCLKCDRRRAREKSAA